MAILECGKITIVIKDKEKMVITGSGKIIITIVNIFLKDMNKAHHQTIEVILGCGNLTAIESQGGKTVFSKSLP